MGLLVVSMGRALRRVVLGANPLAEFQAMGSDDMGERLAVNLRALREARGATQAQLAKLSGLPRATWAHLESGAANPTLAVLHRVSVALQVSFEELLGPPRAGARLYPKGALPEVLRGAATIRKLLPDRIPGTEVDRITLPPYARMAGVPHTPGTREYLAVERGVIVLTASGQSFTVESGDVLSFRGDQRHGYANPGAKPAVGYSVVLLEPVG